MTTKKIVSLANLTQYRMDWKIQVKVLRFWRGATLKGEQFKAFNVILCDQQESRIHAFVPGKCADQHELNLRVGNLCIITNFTVQPYKLEDKFRCVQNDNSLIFSNDTKIRVVEDKGNLFPNEIFDFYEHSELQKLGNKTVYLIDVIGIIQNRESIVTRDFVNRLGHQQLHAKFTITDGSSNINVTLWDNLATIFHNSLLQQVQDPVIIILSSCRCGIWNSDVDLSNVAATTFYLNSDHHSVKEIRKMLSMPSFSQKFLAKQKKKKAELLRIIEIKNLGKEYIESEVIVHANIRNVEDTESWYFNICTGCKQKIQMDNGIFYCDNCTRRIPHPEKKLKVTIAASDETGGAEIVLQDREVRSLIGKRAEELIKQENPNISFPKELKNLANLNVTMKLLIKDLNIVNKITTYWATNICQGFYIPEDEASQSTQALQQSTSNQSTSTYHIDGVSDLNVQ